MGMVYFVDGGGGGLADPEVPGDATDRVHG